jgi:Zn-dependent protease
MLGWSINLFRIRGIQLTVHISFFLLLAYVAQEGYQGGRTPGLLWNVFTLVLFFCCVVLHELGHSFTAMRFGIGVRRILLMPIGGMAEFDDIPRQPTREFLITLAGPAVNFALAFGLWFIVRRFDEESITQYSMAGVLYQLFFGNLLMGCFNFIPAFPMDGGRIFRALLATRLPYLRATFFAVGLGKVISLSVIGFAFAVILRLVSAPSWLPSPTYLAVLFAFIYFAGAAEYRAAKRRELEDAHWRAVLARVATDAPPPFEEPPMLPR